MRHHILPVLGLAATLLISAGAAAAEFESNPCWTAMNRNLEIQCGYLLVPEVRSDPGSRLLRLPVVIFKGRQPDAEAGGKPEPILILNGGPGGSNWVHSAQFLPLWRPFVKALQIPASRDVILFSQRGTDNQQANPVECPVFDEPEYYLGIAKRRGGQTDWRAKLVNGITECRKALEAAGYPLATYSSLANIEDVKDLRSALALDRLAIYGVSYGSRLAVELARHAGAGLTRLILDSPSTPEGDYTFRQVENLLAAIHQLEDICGRNKLCRRHRFVEKNLMRLIKRLDKRPREIRIRSQVGGGKARRLYLKVDSAVLVDVLFFSFYFPDRIAMVPRALSNAIANDFELLTRLAGQAYFFDTGINYVTNTSVFCQDTPSARPSAAIRHELKTYPAFRRYLEHGLWLNETVCPMWLPGAEVHEDLTPRPMAIPTLILSGGMDPVTPLPAARSLLKTLPEASIIFEASATHGALPQSECMRKEVAAFLRAEAVSDKTC